MNRNLTTREEWLADSVYVFERHTKKIRIAGEEEENNSKTKRTGSDSLQDELESLIPEV